MFKGRTKTDRNLMGGGVGGGRSTEYISLPFHTPASQAKSTYSRKGKLNEKQKSCTPITPKKYSCYGLNKIHQKFPTPLPHNFSNGPSLNFTVIFLTVTSKSVCFTHETPLISLKS